MSLSHVYIYNQPDCILPKSFFEGRFIPNFHPDSIDYEQWWNEQISRCINGWSDGGVSVTPAYYYHLNFKKINMLDVKTERPIMEHPYFAYEDQELFNDFSLAREQKKGLILVTGRGFGKSFSVATLVEHEFTFHDVSETIVSASTDKFVTLLWQKIEIGLSSQPSEIKRSLLADGPNEKQSGYQERDPSTKRFDTYDQSAFIRKVVYDWDPEKTRGTRPDLHIFEEVGSWTGSASLLDCFKKTEPSWSRGKFKTTMPIFIGTGGAMDTGGSIDAKMIFEDPATYDLLAFSYQDKKIGKFYPAYSKFGGFYERSGKSDDSGAKAFLDEKREEKKKNPELYRQHTSEFPYNPEEAFQTHGTGIFPVDILERQYANIERSPALQKMVQRGHLDWVRDGSKITGVTWRPDEKNGVFEIIEHPEWTKKDWTAGKVANLYLAGCDSFDSVAESQNSRRDKGKALSKGASYIFKRFYNSATTGRVFVAKIVQRTDDATEFYWNTVKLNLYYSCKMLAEYTKIGIFQHYITEGFEHLLYPRPKLDATIVKESVSTNRYGVAMPDQVKVHIISLLKKYVKDNYDQIFFQSLLRDMMRFTFEGRKKNEHDETMAAAICMLGDDDMYNKKVKELTTSNGTTFPVFRRDKYGNLVFD